MINQESKEDLIEREKKNEKHLEKFDKFYNKFNIFNIKFQDES